MSNKVIELLHSEAADPNALMFMNARDDASLKELSESHKPILTAKCDALDKLIDDNKKAEVHVSEKTARFWEMKRVATSMLMDVLEDGDGSSEELTDDAKSKRQEFFKASGSAWSSLKDTLTQLSSEMIGPYVLGMFNVVIARCITHIHALQATNCRSPTCTLLRGSRVSPNSLEQMPATTAPLSYARSKYTSETPSP